MPLKNLVRAKNRRKHAETVDSLMTMARTMNPGERFPRVRELARALGVTLVTLNHALKQLELRDMIERRPGSGIFVSEHIRQKTIGLVMGDVFATGSSPFYSTLLNMCNRVAESHKEHFSFFLNRPIPTFSSPDAIASPDLVQALDAGKLDGLLLAGSPGDEFTAWLKAHGLPMLSLNKGFGLGSVALDYEGAIRMGASELLKEGCRNLAIAGAYDEEGTYFRKAAEDLGFGYNEAGIFFNYPWDKSKPTPKEYVERLLDYFKKMGTKKVPWGLIVTDDTFASSILPHLAESGIKIGRQLKIASHANKGSLALAEWKKNLILLEVDPSEIAEAMFSRLEILMDGGNPEPEILRICPRVKPGL